MPKVSIIIPVYNTEKFLEQCLSSVCNQTLEDIEIICINDATTDNSSKILETYAQMDKRVKVVELFENSGAGKARNIGIDIADGEYIGFVDSDDFIELEFYEKLYNKARETEADVVKGELWEINNNSAAPQLPAIYDLNNLIKKNKAYFYYTFTSAIFNKNFLNKYNIRFPENLCHLEDPYFTIKAACFYNNIAIVDNAKYYYVVTPKTRAKKSDETTIIKSIHQGILNILDFINSAEIDKEHYNIVLTFLLSQVMDRINNFNQPDDIYNVLLSAMHDIFNKSKYKEEILPNYYNIKRKLYVNNTNLNRFRDIRKNSKDLLLKEYKKFDILNKNQNFIKILVSYIKPDFLFKTDILTPIHLGRAVETANSKDGRISGEDIQWLHDNCIGDNDFEGNISAVNRRVGFLTGTYWAWKNYNKLGNPEYFGSYGHRKLLEAEVLHKIGFYDGALPRKTLLQESIRQQFLNSHGKSALNIMCKIIQKIYPEEFEIFTQFLELDECYLFENYILKKELFFEFCEWIFPLLFEALSYSENEFSIDENEKERILDYFKITGGEYICSQKNFEEYQKRILGFIFERITGYFFYRMETLHNKRFLHTQCRIFEKSSAAKKQKETINV